MSDPSYRPDEDPSIIFQEDTWLQGAMLMSIAYGSVATLSFQCFFMLAKGFKWAKFKRDGLLLVFVLLIFTLSTVFQGTAMQFTQQAFVDDRNFPGGPAAYEVVEFSLPIDSVANVALVISCFLSDMLLLWRCTVIYRNSLVPNWFTVLLASVFWFAEFIIGTLFLVQISTSNIFSEANFTLTFWCFSLALNVLATLLIVSRLFVYRFRLTKVLGSSHGAQYTSVIAMVVESELLYTAFLILYIVPFILSNPLENVFVQGPALVQAVSALMIVYRVAQGKGWTADTYGQISTRMQTSTLQVSNMSTLRAAQSETAIIDEEKGVTADPAVDIVSQEVNLDKESTSSSDL